MQIPDALGPGPELGGQVGGARGVHTSTAGRGAVMWPGCGPHSTPRGVLAAGVLLAAAGTRLPWRPGSTGPASTKA